MKTRLLVSVGAVGLAGVVGFIGSSYGLANNGGARCMGTSETIDHSGVGGSGTDTIGLICCSPAAGFPQQDDDGTVTCFDGDGLPGPGPGNTGGGVGGSGGGGGAGNGNGPPQEDPPECQPVLRPSAPMGTLYMTDMGMKVGGTVVITDELLKNPSVVYVALSDEEIEGVEQKIDSKVAAKEAAAKKCKDTCRSCKKALTAAAKQLTRDLARCEAGYEAIAMARCQSGRWRNDPRDVGKGTPVDKCYWTTTTDGPHTHPIRTCQLTGDMESCLASWTHDIPASQDNSGSGGGSLGIGPISGSFNGGTHSTTLTGRDGYNTGCERLNSDAAGAPEGPVAAYGRCVQSVETANPGVTCDN